MNHIPPISPFGQPIYDNSLNPFHAVNFAKALSKLALTLEDSSYKDANGKTDIDQLGGMVDVLLYFDTEFSHPKFHSGVTKLCKQFEDFRKNPQPELITPMQTTLKSLGKEHPEISHNQYIDLVLGVLSHIKENVHDS